MHMILQRRYFPRIILNFFLRQMVIKMSQERQYEGLMLQFYGFRAFKLIK